MPIRMSHPKHGFTHAYNNNDISYLISLGWRVHVEEVKEVDKKVELSDDEIRAAYFKKFGKKPHHMAKIETLRKALDDNS